MPTAVITESIENTMSSNSTWPMTAPKVGVMLVASGPIYQFVNRHPSVKVLALAFLLLIGMTLIAEGFGQKIPKGYIYGSMAFSVFVEMVNIGVRRKKTSSPVQLHDRPTAE